MRKSPDRRSIGRIATLTAVLAAVLLSVSALTASADDAASGRLATQLTTRPGAFNSFNGQTSTLETRFMPRYVLLKHDPTQTEPGYFSLVIGATIGDDFKTTCSSATPQICVNPQAVQPAEVSFDKANAIVFRVSVAYDDGRQIQMTRPSNDDGEQVRAGIPSDRKPQTDLGGALGVEIKLPPAAIRIVRVEVAADVTPTDPKDAAATKAYPAAGSAWGAGMHPWIWSLSVAVASGVVPGAAVPVTGVGGASDPKQAAVDAGGPGSPGYEAALAAIAAMLAAWAALFGLTLTGGAAPAGQQLVPGDDGLPLPGRPTKGTPTAAAPEEHWTTPLPPGTTTDPVAPAGALGEDGLPLPDPSKVKLAPKPEHWTTPRPPEEEHWTTPRPEPTAIDPAAAAAALANTPHTVEREGTGAAPTPAGPTPVDPATTPEGIARADELRKAQAEFKAAKDAYDANPFKGYDQATTTRMMSARLNLELAESHQTEVVHDGRRGEPALLTKPDDIAARNVLQDVAKERQRIDRMPADQRELASRGTVMAGQGDQVRTDPSLAPTDVGEQGKWALQMKDKIADLDQKIAATKNESGFTQAKLNQLTSARDAAAARLQIYRDGNYDTEPVNIEDSNRAFGVMAKSTLKIVDLGSQASAQQAQGTFSTPEAPLRQSDDTKNLLAREYVQQSRDAGPGVVSKVWDWVSSPFRSGKPEATEPNAAPPEGGAPGPRGQAPAATAGEPHPSGGPRGESPAVAPEPSPSGGIHDAPTKVDLPAAGSKPLPEGMVRNQYGEIVFTEPTPAQHATEIEVRNLNIDKELGSGGSPAYHGDYSKPMGEVRAEDIAALKAKGPEFWNSLQDPKQKLYLEQLRDSPSPGLQIDKSMGPAFNPAGPGDGLKQQLGGLVKGTGAPVSPNAPTADVPSAGTPTQDLPHVGPGQTQLLPPGEPKGEVPPRGRP